MEMSHRTGVYLSTYGLYSHKVQVAVLFHVITVDADVFQGGGRPVSSPGVDGYIGINITKERDHLISSHGRIGSAVGRLCGRFGLRGTAFGEDNVVEIMHCGGTFIARKIEEQHHPVELVGITGGEGEGKL